MRNLAIFCCLAVVLCAAATPSGTNDLDVSNGHCTSTLSGGDGFIQIGSWRFGAVDDNHFSFSSNNGRTAVILRSDGTVHGGNGHRSDWGLSHKPITWTYSASKPFALESLPNIQFGPSWVQFGPNCRLGTPDNVHLSVSFKVPCCGASGIHTADIWRDDGTVHPGPRSCCGLGQLNTFQNALSNGNVWFGDKFLQLGDFRIADIDGGHMSIAFVSTGKTAEIFRHDSTQHPGPRTDYNANSRAKCALLAYQQSVNIKTSDVSKQMSDMIDQTVQKNTESYNQMKQVHSHASTAADASKTLFDSATSEAARLKRELESAMAAESSSKVKCETDSNSLISATAAHSSAVASSKGVATIDNELAVIQQLRQKLQELTDIKAVQASASQANVQLGTKDAVAHAISDASADASLRPSTSLMLAEVMAGMGNGRSFSETRDISKLLDAIVDKLNAEKLHLQDTVAKTKTAVETATTSRAKSCSDAKVASELLTSSKSAFKAAEEKLRARTDELNAANAEAARILKLFNEFKATYDSESASFARIKQYLSSGSDSNWETAKAALQSQINDLTDQLKKCGARVSEFEAVAKANAESENSKVTASGVIEDFPAQGLAGQVLVQAICVAIQKAAGWTFAVKRTCGNNDETCEKVCGTESQSGALEPFNAIHMYGNQATAQAGVTGLKTYRYNSGRGGGGCGPNYCCCGGGGAQALLEIGEATSVEEFLEGAEEIGGGDNSAFHEQASIDDLANHMVDESDLEMQKMPAQSLAGAPSTFEQFGAAGQILAQAACTAISPAGGYNFAIIKGCEIGTECSVLCAQAGKQSGSPTGLECKESLHLYKPGWNSRKDADLKVYRYFGCGGSCGPNYCCCHGKADFKLTDLEAAENDVDDDEESGSKVAVNALEMQSKTFVSSTAAQVLAESACTSINSAGGWTFAIRRTSTDKRACQNVCSEASESQAGHLKCVDSLSIGGTNHPMVDDESRVKLGLMTYRHGNCIDTSANYCCCKNL